MKSKTLWLATLLLLPLVILRPTSGKDGQSMFDGIIDEAEFRLSKGELDQCRELIDRALERDDRALAAWDLRYRWAEAVNDRDEQIYTLHKQLQLSIAQNISRSDLARMREKLIEVDPVAGDYLSLSNVFVSKLESVAQQYEKERRPHSAIRVHQEILALDPECQESKDKIQKISSAPDPSLAETAKPKDLLEDYSNEYIAKRNAKHSNWKNKDELKRPNYITQTDAGFEVLIRAAEAMEQMNAFYREFFQYGTPRDGKSVSRIYLKIFKNQEDYLKYGSSPVDWSAGQFTGSAVETFISGGFETMTGTLFHEAAHQFVALATSASGWLNEGLASFFEGTRILSNGTVLMNLPANHRLFPLVQRMERGWMSGHDDGIDRNNANQTPETAPTFRIVLENKYQWGPPWYAPTWGVVYFLYNYQDPVDGRFVYRAAFREFINVSGGLQGDTAVQKFEETVLYRPQKPTKNVDFSSSPFKVELPRTVDELSPVWKSWLIRLRDEQSGRSEPQRPYLAWGEYAIVRKDYSDAKEHFEKGIVGEPDNVEMLVAFGELLGGHYRNPDRASKLALQAIRALERDDPVYNKEAIKDIEKKLVKWDPRRKNLDKIRDQIWTRSEEIVERYLAEGLPMMAMDVSWRLGTALNMPKMFALFEKAARDSGKTLSLWHLAYNETDLRGWAAAGESTFTSQGKAIRAKYGEPQEGDYSYQFLTLDTVTSGDFSMKAEIRAVFGKNTYSGLVFGKKGDSNFHSVIFFPGKQRYSDDGSINATGYVDLTTFFGAGVFKTWRHNPVETSTGDWHEMRLDVIGSIVDVWFDGKLVVSQDFKLMDVLRGSFGLITGPGKAEFRNIRYISRRPRDPGAAIERKIRMEGSDASAVAKSSFIGKVPPFPTTESWLQEPRTDWKEKGYVPTVLVFWSMEQNNIIAIDEWLRDLADDYANIDLQVVTVSQKDGADNVRDYLEEFPLPGSAAVDLHHKTFFGETFSDFFIGDVYNLPRVLLLDIDQRVFWEGDPGYSSTEPYEPGKESYVQGPLDDLIAQRNLVELVPWRLDWEEYGKEAICRGKLDDVAEQLVMTRNLPGIVPAVANAKRYLRDIEGALDTLEATAEILSQAEAEPALVLLLEWADLIEFEVDADKKKLLKKNLKNKRIRDWAKALKKAKSVHRKLVKSQLLKNVEPLIKQLGGMDGMFPKILLELLEAPFEAGDVEGTMKVLEMAKNLPARWLTGDHFKWFQDAS